MSDLTLEPTPPGSTLEIIDSLRGGAEFARAHADGLKSGDWLVLQPDVLAANLERAADHIDDLAGQVVALEANVARLNERVLAYRKSFRHAEQWVRWIATEAEDCEVVRAPSDLSRQCAGIVPLVEPIPQNREETPAP